MHTITLQYFDSIPVAISLSILKTGFLFAPAEKGNHNLYKFLGIGTDEKDPVITDSTMEKETKVFFCPRKLKNLELVDEL